MHITFYCTKQSEHFFFLIFQISPNIKDCCGPHYLTTSDIGRKKLVHSIFLVLSEGEVAQDEHSRFAGLKHKKYQQMAL